MNANSSDRSSQQKPDALPVVAWQGRPSPTTWWQEVTPDVLSFRRDVQKWEIRSLADHAQAEASLLAKEAECEAMEARAELAEQAHVCAAEERDHLRALVKDMRTDADRYRLLRRGQHWSVINGIGDTLRAESLDAAIDAARAAADQGGA